MEASLPISAVVDGTAVAHSDSLYLLDDRGMVLSYRGERNKNRGFKGKGIRFYYRACNQL